MSVPTVEPVTADPVDQARALGPLLRAHAGEAERAGTLPTVVVDALAAAGLFRLWLPRGLGGREVEPQVILRTVEALAAADGSAAWCTMIGNSGMFLAWMDQDLAAALLDGHADAAMSGTFAPGGRAVREPGGLRIRGRWQLSSGCPHSRLHSGGVLIGDERPEWRWAVHPASAATIDPTWTGAMGLRGTGSHDVVVEDVLVPEGHTVMPFHEPPVVDSPLYRVPFFSLIKMLMVGFPLGVARHALDLAGELALTKIRTGPGPLAEEQDVQIRLGIAEAGLRAARAHVVDELEAVWAVVLAGDEPSDVARGRFTLAVNGALTASLTAVDEAFVLAGAQALYAGDEIQRCWRDLHAAAAHRLFGRAQWQGGAKALLGLEVDRVWL